MNKRRLLTSVAVISLSLTLAAGAHAAGSASSTGTSPTTASSTKPVASLYGKINPFYGKINPFYGKINPFYGKINPFWGKINPFTETNGDFWGALTETPMWAQVAPFWDNLGTSWGNISTYWSGLGAYSSSTSAQYTTLQSMMQAFDSTSSATWSAAIQKNGQAWASFSAPLYAKYGFNLNDPKSFSGATDETRARFMIDWYDGLMNFTGMDHVDWWMGAADWQPSLTQDQGAGAATVFGLLDASVAPGTEMYSNITSAGGYTTYQNDHGAEVSSLIFSKMDGKGVMGLAPNAKLVNYNPFDATGTASFQDVRNGMVALAAKGVQVVNMSLGVPGWTLHQGIADIIMDPSLYNQFHNVVFVLAAGNDGKAQTVDLNENSWVPTDNYIIVGSVGLDGRISSFSNMPGTACVKTYGTCQPKDKLMNHFIVAPGELILVSDNHGGLVRESGTSFAAPLVSGTLALMYNRWPWLQNYPKDTVQMILQSAKDLGAPGVDPVYGWGELDIQAAQSPLNYDNLLIFQGWNQILPVNLKKSLLSQSQLGTWQAQGASIYATEYFDATYRDFAIPLSSLVYGTNMNRNGVTERFQRYMYGRMVGWANGTYGLAGNALTDIESYTTPSADLGSWSFAMTATAKDESANTGTPRATDALLFEPGYSFHNAATATDVRFGFGSGAAALTAQQGFGFRSDYDVKAGGVNPVLGFASGGAYIGGAAKLSKSVGMSFGFTQNVDDNAYANPFTHEIQAAVKGIQAYNADAMFVKLAYDATSWMKLGASYTLLDEATGLLGVQGAGAFGLSGGALTDAVTTDATFDLGSKVTLAASATAAKTRATSFSNSAIAVGDGGITSTAFELALSKSGVIRDDDAVRLSVTQPLHIENGSLDYTSWRVVNRQTGAFGLVTDKWGVSNGDRQLLAELLYARPILDGAGQVSFSGQMDMNGAGSLPSDQTYSVGSRLSFQF